MSKIALGAMRRLAFSYVLIQVIVVLLISILLFLLDNNIAAYSFLLGGIVNVLPNAYFAHNLFKKTGAQATREIVISFYLGEVVKFIITILLFTIIFKFFNTNKLALFLGYIMALFTFWLTTLIKNQTANRL